MSSYGLMEALEAAGVAESFFDLDYGQELSEDGGGEVRARDMRPALWKLKFQVPDMYLDHLADLEAALATLRGSIGTFWAWSPARQYPRFDPTGAVVASSSVQINSLNVSDATLISFKGLPAGYTLKAGDLFDFDYSTVVTCKALHRITTPTVVANGSGVTPVFSVAPAIRPGAAGNAAVNLRRPVGQFRLIPGAWSTSASRVMGVASIEAIQVIEP